MTPARTAAQMLAANTQQRVDMLASALLKAAQNPGLTNIQRAHAAAGLEALRAMVDNVKAAVRDRRLSVGMDPGFSPAALKRVLPKWNDGLIEAEQHLQAATGQGFSDYASGVMGSMRGMGIWSWNPNLWGLTQDEALAYEQKLRDAEVEQAKTNAQVNSIDPSITSTMSQSVQSMVQASANTYNLLLLVGVAGLGIWAYSEYKTAKKARA